MTERRWQVWDTGTNTFRGSYVTREGAEAYVAIMCATYPDECAALTIVGPRASDAPAKTARQGT